MHFHDYTSIKHLIKLLFGTHLAGEQEPVNMVTVLVEYLGQY